MTQRRYAWTLISWLLAGCDDDAAAPPSLAGGAGALGASGGVPGAAGGSAGHAGFAPRGGSAGNGAAAGDANQAGRAGSTSSMEGGGAGASSAGSSVGGANGQAGADNEGGAENPGSAGLPGAGSAGTPSAECRSCGDYAEPMAADAVNVAGLDALSGLAVSRTQPDIILAHNDHDRAVVYALDFHGRERARVSLENAAATDIEDIAVGACDDAWCVYLGDIGDNNARRSEYAVLRFALPSVPATPGSAPLTPEFERLRFVYEDGSHNAESILVGPDGTVYVVTKLAAGSGGRVTATGPSSVYRLPRELTADSVATATKVATLTVPAEGDFAASAAAAHPCGLGFLLRTYDKVYEFTTPDGMDFEAAFSATPNLVGTPDEPQSEGIDYLADGRGFVTSGEGDGAPIVQTDCVP